MHSVSSSRRLPVHVVACWCCLQAITSSETDAPCSLVSATTFVDNLVGAVVQEAYTFPWYKDTPKLFTQGHDYGTHNGSLLQVLIFTSFFEIMTLPAVIQMVKGESDREPGNFGLDFFGMMAKDPTMKKKEIKNGRLAILAISYVPLRGEDASLCLECSLPSSLCVDSLCAGAISNMMIPFPPLRILLPCQGCPDDLCAHWPGYHRPARFWQRRSQLLEPHRSHAPL